MKEADKTENKTKKIEKYAKNEEKSKNYTTQSTYYFVDRTYIFDKKKKKKTEHKKEKKTTTRNSRFIKSLFGNFEKRLHLLYFSFFFFGQTLFLPPLFLLFFAIYIYLSKRHIILPFCVRISVPIYLILIKLKFFFSKKAICI